MKIKKFNKLFEAFNDSHFTISDEDIEDVCTELTDIGYGLRIDRRYINRGKDRSISDEPLTTQTSPMYEITLFGRKEELDEIDYWNGGLYFQESAILTSFDSIVSRFKKMYSNALVIWNNSGNQMRIRIILSQIETEIGFDANDFSSRITDWSTSFDMPIKCEDNFGSSKERTIEFRRYYAKDELSNLLKNSTENINNKSDFDQVLRSFDDTFGKETRNIKYKYIPSLLDKPVEFSYEFNEIKKIEYQPEYKSIFKKPAKRFFTWYSLVINYKIIK